MEWLGWATDRIGKRRLESQRLGTWTDTNRIYLESQNLGKHWFENIPEIVFSSNQKPRKNSHRCGQTHHSWITFAFGTPLVFHIYLGKL